MDDGAERHGCSWDWKKKSYVLPLTQESHSHRCIVYTPTAIGGGGVRGLWIIMEVYGVHER